MQQFIFIPEMACIVRKDAEDGRHVAYHGHGYAKTAERNYNDLLAGHLTECQLYWDRPGRIGYRNIAFTKETT